MKTIVLERPGNLVLSEGPAPRNASPQEALVRVHRVGICGTDIHAYRGKQPFFNYPRILGHELGVEILEVQANEFDLHGGDRCAVEPYLNCGCCGACRMGRPNCCERMQVMGVHVDGGLRERITVPVSKLHRSAKLSLDELALVETLAIGAHAVQRAQVAAGEFALVIGAGPIGLSVVQFAQTAGARVIVMDMDPSRLAFCRQQFHVGLTLEADEGSLSALREITGGQLSTAVFDATGNVDSMNKAFGFVAHGGRLVLVGLVQGNITFHDPDFHRREMTVFSSRNALGDDFRRIIRLIEAGKVRTAPWITHRAPLAAMIEEFPRWITPGSGLLKAMVEV